MRDFHAHAAQKHQAWRHAIIQPAHRNLQSNLQGNLGTHILEDAVENRFIHRPKPLAIFGTQLANPAPETSRSFVVLSVVAISPLVGQGPMKPEERRSPCVGGGDGLALLDLFKNAESNSTQISPSPSAPWFLAPRKSRNLLPLRRFGVCGVFERPTDPGRTAASKHWAHNLGCCSPSGRCCTGEGARFTPLSASLYLVFSALDLWFGPCPFALRRNQDSKTRMPESSLWQLRPGPVKVGDLTDHRKGTA